MVEKVITLDNISPAEVLGTGNRNIKELAIAFPKSKIISRGNEIKIIGSSSEIHQIQSILNSLISHYDKYGNITQESVKMYLKDDDTENTSKEKIITNTSIILYGAKGKTIKAKSDNQQKLVNAIKSNDLVFAIGPAGSGKTYIAVAMAVRALKDKVIKKIIITRPAVEAGENLGFLPGDLAEKVDPYLRPIYDALEDMIPIEKLEYYKESGIIEIAPLAYMRGRTLDNAYVLLDEAQNTTTSQIKMFLTRIGPKAKMIITGDISQIDLPKNQKSGLVEATKTLKDIEGIVTVMLEGKDVVRHPLVKKIIAAYEQEDNN